MSENCGEANPTVKFFDAIDTFDKKYKLLSNAIVDKNNAISTAVDTHDINAIDQKDKFADIESFQFKQQEQQQTLPTLSSFTNHQWSMEFQQQQQQQQQKQWQQSQIENQPSWSREYSSHITTDPHPQKETLSSFQGWTKEFMEKYQEFEDELNVNASSSSWTREYQQQDHQNHQSQNQKSWADEFREQQENKELMETAKRMLAQVNIEQDPKLKSSRFIAFLKELSGEGKIKEEGYNYNYNYNYNHYHDHQEASSTAFSTCHTAIDDANTAITNWKNQYMESISPLITEKDKEWLSMEKDWLKYKTSGYGYEGFIWEEYSVYNYSTSSLTLNPYSSCTLEQADSITNLRDAILAWESIVYRDSTNAYGWSRLGRLQQLNEMDNQAIAAFIRVLQLQPQRSSNHDDLLLSFAASCANETCIADCIDILERYVGIAPLNAANIINSNDNEEEEGSVNKNANQHENTENKSADTDIFYSSDRMGNLIRALQVKGDDMALSIVYNISGNYQLAIECLERLISNPSSPLSKDNRIIALSRLGATLANAKRYPEALNVYSQANSISPNTPRILYNMGISMMCMDKKLEAASLFIQALENQLSVSISAQRDIGNANGIWESIQQILVMLSREDLVLKCKERDLNAIKFNLGLV